MVVIESRQDEAKTGSAILLPALPSRGSSSLSPELAQANEVQAAVFNRGGVAKRDGFLRKARQVFEEDGTAETVTETLRQTVTVNGAGALGPPNATVTETVTVSVNVGGGAEVPPEGAGEGGVNDEAFEG